LDGCFGGQVARCGQRVQTVGGELVGRYVVAQFAGLGAFDEQVADEVAQLVLCSDDMFTAVQESHEFSVVALVGDVGVVLEDRLESRGGRCRLVAHGGELLQRIFYTSALVSIQHSLSSKALYHRKRADGWVRGLASLGFNGPDHGCGS